MTTRRNPGTFGWEYEQQRTETTQVGDDGFVPTPPVDPPQLITEVTLRFEGQELKGYSDAYDIEKKNAPHEVYLDDCVGNPAVACAGWQYASNSDRVALPHGGQEGDVLIAIVFDFASTALSAVPTGWDSELGTHQGPYNGEYLGDYVWSKKWDNDSGYLVIERSVEHLAVGLIRGVIFNPPQIGADDYPAGFLADRKIYDQALAFYLTTANSVLITAFCSVSPVLDLVPFNTFLDFIPGGPDPQLDHCFIQCGTWEGGWWREPVAGFITANQGLYCATKLHLAGFS